MSRTEVTPDGRPVSGWLLCPSCLESRTSRETQVPVMFDSPIPEFEQLGLTPIRVGTMKCQVCGYEARVAMTVV